MTSPAMRNFVHAGCVEGDSQHQTYRGHDRIRRRAPESDAPSAHGSADDPRATTTGGRGGAQGSPVVAAMVVAMETSPW